MSAITGIEWTDATWNVVVGCSKVSPGCDNCYAIRTAHRMSANPNPKVSVPYAGTEADGEWTGQVNLVQDRLDLPLRWRRPRRIFVNAQADLFHQDVPDDFIARVFAVMAYAHRHTFQLLTKRHARMRSLLSSESFVELFDREFCKLPDWAERCPDPDDAGHLMDGPLRNVWLGVSAENQQWADIRIPALLDTPAAIRFVSAEPLLGPIDLHPYWLHGRPTWGEPTPTPAGPGAGGNIVMRPIELAPALNWVIVGGESGRGARPMHPDWARSLRDQCQGAGVAFHFKQRGEWTWNEIGQFRIPTKPYTDRVAVMHPAGMTAMEKGNPFNPFERGHPNWATRIERAGRKSAGRELDGRTWDEFPGTAARP